MFFFTITSLIVIVSISFHCIIKVDGKYYIIGTEFTDSTKNFLENENKIYDNIRLLKEGGGNPKLIWENIDMIKLTIIFLFLFLIICINFSVSISISLIKYFPPISIEK